MGQRLRSDDDDLWYLIQECVHAHGSMSEEEQRDFMAGVDRLIMERDAKRAQRLHGSFVLTFNYDGVIETMMRLVSVTR